MKDIKYTAALKFLIILQGCSDNQRIPLRLSAA